MQSDQKEGGFPVSSKTCLDGWSAWKRCREPTIGRHGSEHLATKFDKVSDYALAKRSLYESRRGHVPVAAGNDGVDGPQKTGSFTPAIDACSETVKDALEMFDIPPLILL
jgi:hypothetical protein